MKWFCLKWSSFGKVAAKVRTILWCLTGSIVGWQSDECCHTSCECDVQWIHVKLATVTWLLRWKRPRHIHLWWLLKVTACRHSALYHWKLESTCSLLLLATWIFQVTKLTALHRLSLVPHWAKCVKPTADTTAGIAVLSPHGLKRVCMNLRCMNVLYCCNYIVQCFDAVGWAAGRPSGL